MKFYDRENHLELFGKDVVYCEHCLTYMIYDEIPSMKIHVCYESHPYGSTNAIEEIQIGFDCPNCENHNEF